MPSAVLIANRLAELTQAELATLIESRPWGMGRQLDVHDVADTLISKESIDNTMRGLSREALESIHVGKAIQLCRLMMLADADGNPYPEVAAALPDIPTEKLPALPVGRGADASTALHTVVALRDLIDWVHHEPLAMAATGKLLRAETKLLSDGLVIPEREVEPLVWMAAEAGLVRISDRRMRATFSGVEILDDLPAVWSRAAESILAAVGESVEASARIAHRLDASYLKWAWPLGGSTRDDTIRLVVAGAEMLGLLAGTITDSGRLWLDGSPEGVPVFPTLSSSVYVLDDLSVIAPGPITTAVSNFLMTISRLESRGLASKRRLDPGRVLNTVSGGVPVEVLIDTLRDLSLTPLTTAITSTIVDVATNSRFITLSGTGTDTAARVSHPELGAMLVSDPRLQRLAPVTVDNMSVLFGAAPDRVEATLVDGGYTVVSPTPEPSTAQPLPESPLRVMAKHIFEVGLGTSHMERALIVAGKTRTRVTLTVETSTGPRTMTLEPRNVANGRVRGLDTVSDVERTLPISAIITLTTAGEQS